MQTAKQFQGGSYITNIYHTNQTFYAAFSTLLKQHIIGRKKWSEIALERVNFSEIFLPSGLVARDTTISPPPLLKSSVRP